MGKVWFSFIIHFINVQIRDVIEQLVTHVYFLLFKTYISFLNILFWKVVSPEIRCPDTFCVVGFLESVCAHERELIYLNLLLYSESPSQQLEAPQDFSKT